MQLLIYYWEPLVEEVMNKLNSSFADDVIWISCLHMHHAGEKRAHTLMTFKLMICLICHLSLHGGKMRFSSWLFFLFNLTEGTLLTQTTACSKQKG